MCRLRVITQQRRGKQRGERDLRTDGCGRLAWKDEPASQPKTGSDKGQEENQEPQVSRNPEKEDIEGEGARNHEKSGRMRTDHRPLSWATKNQGFLRISFQ